MKAQNFDLRIRKGVSGYEVEARGPEDRSAGPCPSPLDLTDPVLQGLRGGTAAPQDLVEIGRRLYAGLFPDPIQACFSECCGAAGREGILRVWLSAADTSPELSRLPWELLYDETRRNFLALDFQPPIVRRPASPFAVRPVRTTAPLRILIAVSLPQDQGQLQAEAEVASIKQKLSHLIERGAVEIRALYDVTWETLQAGTEDCQALHYIGHGAALDQGYLALENREGYTDPTDERRLRNLVRNRPDLRLIVLNACETAAVSASGRSLGLAHAIARAGAPAVVAMQYSIADEHARDFAATFYERLADGDSVERALTEARLALGGEDDPAWATPVLLMRSDKPLVITKPVVPPAETGNSQAGPWDAVTGVLALLCLVGLLGLAAVLNWRYAALAGMIGSVAAAAYKILEKLGYFKKLASGVWLRRTWRTVQRHWAGRGGLIGLLIALALVWSTWGVTSVGQLLATPTPVSTPGLPRMPEGFNIAVAGMGDAAGESGEIGAQITKWLARYLKEELQNARLGLVPDVDLFPDQRPRSEREAAELAEQVNAQMVVYGDVIESRGIVSITPLFYTHNIPNIGETIAGQDDLGKAITTTMPFSADSWTNELEPKLSGRAWVLAEFAAALVKLQANDAKAAVRLLDQAIRDMDAQGLPPKAVFHLFLGTAYLARNSAGDLELARQEYMDALSIDASYARALMGLGNISYLEAIHAPAPPDQSALAQAIAWYTKACAAALPPDEPVSADDCPIEQATAANIGAKVRVQMGHVYVAMAQPHLAGEPDDARELLQQAEAQYLPVIQAYDGGRTDLRALTGEAYLGLGLAYEDLRGPRAAADAYRHALDLTVRAETQQQASIRLACTCDRMTSPLDLITRNQWCRDLAYTCAGKSIPYSPVHPVK